MIRENQKILNRIQVLLDGCVIASSLILAFVLRFNNYKSGDYIPLSNYLKALIIIIPLYLFLYSLFGLYLPHRNKDLTEEALNITSANIIGVIILLSILFIIKEVNYSRLVILLFAFFSILFTVLERFTVRKTLRFLRKQGYNIKYILVIGAGELGQQFVQKLKANKELGYSIIGFLDERKKVGRKIHDVEVIGRLSDLENIINKTLIDEIIVTLSIKEYDLLKEIIKIGEKSGVKVQIVPDYLKYIPAKPYIDEIDGMPLINIRRVPLDNIGNYLIKRTFDISVSLICLILLSPIMLTTAILIKLTSPGPIIFKQERVGLNRRTFMMYKFRSMKVQTDEESDTRWTTENDPRRTKIGTFIRKTSIDELPQLFNVLKGDMSLIGPRPERPYFVEQFKEEIPKYMVKHQVRPGITGWAQVNGWRGDTSIEERIKCDIYYIENWSLALDIKILVLTVFKGFVNKNAY
ncbi:MAG: undecaprenyl-phosphate glucose phosphotransferase [Clostridia bacterium]|nr:undecaprenyl-phosphate glucose phosphotransferase [Clostridia bacterium]